MLHFFHILRINLPGRILCAPTGLWQIRMGMERPVEELRMRLLGILELWKRNRGVLENEVVVPCNV